MFEILAYSEWSATVQGKLLKDCLESTVRYDSNKYEIPMTVYKILYTLTRGTLNVDEIDKTALSNP